MYSIPSTLWKTLGAVVVTSVLLIGPAGAEDCRKAKEFYTAGAKLLNFQERATAFQKAVDLCPTYAEAHVNLADAYENVGDFHAAEKHYREGIALGLASPIPFIGLGEVYLKTGRYTLAAESYEKGIEKDPANERLKAGLKIAAERTKREKTLFTAGQMKNCLIEDEQFRLMCMCPSDRYSFLRKWICMPALLFAPGSAALSKEVARQMDEVGEVLKTNELAGTRWLIIGHADSMGERSANLGLARSRGQRVKRYLTDRHAVDPQRLKVLFFGQDRPRSPNTTSEGRAENRRVEIVVEDM